MATHAEPIPSDAVDSLSRDPVLIRDWRPSPLWMLRETWRQRGLIPRLGIRRTVKGYSGTRLGRVWLLAQPLISIFGMTLVFGSVLQAPSNGVPYMLFLVVGMTGWLAFERTVHWGTRSVDHMRKIAGRLEVPVLLVPTAGLTPMLLDLSIMLLIGIGTACGYWITEGYVRIELGPQLLLALAGYVLAIAIGWGVALWLATLNAKARDVRITLKYVMQVWLFVTPVVYATAAVPERWRFLTTINPVVAPVELVKKGFFGVGSVSGTSLAVSLVACVLLCVSGLLFLTWMSPTLLRAPTVFDDDDDV